MTEIKSLCKVLFQVYSALGSPVVPTVSITEIDFTSRLFGSLDELFVHRSTLPNATENLSSALLVIKNFNLEHRLLRINHLGICYKVPTIQAEIRRINDKCSQLKVPAFQEPSIDLGAWLFIGSIDNDISATMLEMIPHEGKVAEPYMEYWLPHIHFDIDVSLTREEVLKIIRKYISNPLIPYEIQIDGIVYTQRIHVGCIDGINIFLDISNTNRIIEYRRTWKRLTP